MFVYSYSLYWTSSPSKQHTHPNNNISFKHYQLWHIKFQSVHKITSFCFTQIFIFFFCGHMVYFVNVMMCAVKNCISFLHFLWCFCIFRGVELTQFSPGELSSTSVVFFSSFSSILPLTMEAFSLF